MTDSTVRLAISGLAVLDAFGRTAGAATMEALEEAMAAGGDPAVAVVASQSGDLPEVLMCLRTPSGLLLPFARVPIDEERTLQ